MEMTVKAVAGNNPNARREGTPKYHQAINSELLQVWGDPRARHLKPFRLLGITIQQRGTGGRHLKESGKTGLLWTLR